MHLQVAKLEVNSGNYKQAQIHIAAAKEIDPDFCDVGYQEALYVAMDCCFLLCLG